MSRTGWSAKTGVGRYLRHRYPYYNRLQYRQSGVIGASLDRLSDSPVLIAGAGSRPLAGGAFHQRIGLEYADLDLATSGATRGRRRAVGRGASIPDRHWDSLCQRTRDLAAALRGRSRIDDLSDPDELELARLCGVLSLYEQVDVSRRELPITTVPATASTDDLLAWVSADVCRDVVEMTAVFKQKFCHALATEPVLIEPNLHPGQADLLLGGLLIELKTTMSALISDEYAYTLLEYLLLADGDTLPAGTGVTHIGWYFARHGTPWVYEVPDFLGTLAGVAVTKDEATAEFAVLFDSEPHLLPSWMRDLMNTPVTRSRLTRPRRAGPTN